MPIAQEDVAGLVEQIARQIFESFEIAGLAVGIVKDNEVIYSQGFGVKSITTQEPVTSTSLFHLASISKPFVATAMLQLFEQGKLDLDTPVVKYLPYFKINDDRFSQVTIRQMLTHTSGMPDVQDYQWDQPEDDDGALERYVHSLSDEMLLFTPGDKFAYSNMAYEVLGDVIAKVSGQAFEAYMEAHILQPLAMGHSTFLKQKVSPELGTTPHLNVPHPIISSVYPYHRAHAPSSTLHSNVLEMGHWAIANLNMGRFQGQQILNASSYELLWHPYANIGEDDPPTWVGLSWFISTYKGCKTISHSGGDIGFRTNLVLLPEKSMAVIVLANTIPAPVEIITNAILDVILGFAPQLPKPPLIIPLSRTLTERGLEAALEDGCRLAKRHLDTYDFSPAQFYDTGYVLIEINRLREAIEILRLGINIHPGSDELYYLLGWAYMKSGAKALATKNMRQCLKLNSNHREANKLLKALRQAQH